MIEALPIAVAMTVSEPLKIWRVCLDRTIELVSPVERVSDFMLLTINNRDKTGRIKIYIGYHPSVGNENRRYTTGDYRDKIVTQKKKYLREFGILGIHSKDVYPYFLIYGARKSDLFWASKYINFCE